MIISLEFSIYHFFVIKYFTSYGKAAFLTIILAIGGRILLYIKEKFGLLVVSLTHLGADWGIIHIMFLIIYYVN